MEYINKYVKSFWYYREAFEEQTLQVGFQRLTFDFIDTFIGIAISSCDAIGCCWH